MLNALKLTSNQTRTENGAATYAGTMSDCLDLFATIGALRHASDQEITDRFMRAYSENADLAMKILFYARDVRGGLGERRVFRVIMNWLADHEPQSVRKNLSYVAEYGRWDDLLCLMDTVCEPVVMDLIRDQLKADQAAMEAGSSVSLLGKWLPSVNTSDKNKVRLARRIAKALGMKEAAYRKLLVALRKQIAILENNLRERDYSFPYETQPSKAMFKYRQAFLRNDGDRYCAFMEQVRAGSASLHTGTLTPYEIVRPLLEGPRLDTRERNAIDATWNALEDFTQDENALVVIDGSGSMYGYGEPVPASVALSLGIYFAEHNTGLFHNHFITFSSRPQLVEIKGSDLYSKVQYCASFDEVADTNLQSVFELILNTAVREHIPQEQMPSRLYIISDMEFNDCVKDGDVTNFEYAKRLFISKGYRLPDVVFWNVASRSRQQPVTQNEQGVALVSGCSPQVFSMMTSGTLTPYHFMMDTLMSERYRPIAA